MDRPGRKFRRFGDGQAAGRGDGCGEVPVRDQAQPAENRRQGIAGFLLHKPRAGQGLAGDEPLVENKLFKDLGQRTSRIWKSVNRQDTDRSS